MSRYIFGKTPWPPQGARRVRIHEHNVSGRALTHNEAKAQRQSRPILREKGCAGRLTKGPGEIWLDKTIYEDNSHDYES